MVDDLLVDQDSVSSHPVDSVGNGFRFDIQISGYFPDTRSIVYLCVNVLVVEVYFDEVVDGEALRREAGMAAITAVSLNDSRAFSGILAVKVVPAGGYMVCSLSIAITFKRVAHKQKKAPQISWRGLQGVAASLPPGLFT